MYYAKALSKDLNTGGWGRDGGGGENMGAHLNAYTSREQTVYYAKALSKDLNTGGWGRDYFVICKFYAPGMIHNSF